MPTKAPPLSGGVLPACRPAPPGAAAGARSARASRAACSTPGTELERSPLDRLVALCAARTSEARSSSGPTSSRRTRTVPLASAPCAARPPTAFAPPLPARCRRRSPPPSPGRAPVPTPPPSARPLLELLVEHVEHLSVAVGHARSPAARAPPSRGESRRRRRGASRGCPADPHAPVTSRDVGRFHGRGAVTCPWVWRRLTRCCLNDTPSPPAPRVRG